MYCITGFLVGSITMLLDITRMAKQGSLYWFLFEIHSGPPYAADAHWFYTICNILNSITVFFMFGNVSFVAII